jgi:hypothetical protein
MALALFGIALALGAGACGGGSGDGSTGGGTAGSTATAADTTSSTGTTTSTDETTARSKQEGTPKGTTASCSSQLGGFLDDLDGLRKSLVIGVSYEQYVAELGTLRRSYEKLPVDRFDFACLSGPATSAEESFDGYLAAANTWGDCVSEEGCETAALEPRLQREWHAAARLLRHAQQTINRLNE